MLQTSDAADAADAESYEEISMSFWAFGTKLNLFPNNFLSFVSFELNMQWWGGVRVGEEEELEGEEAKESFKENSRDFPAPAFAFCMQEWGGKMAVSFF